MDRTADVQFAGAKAAPPGHYLLPGETKSADGDPSRATFSSMSRPGELPQVSVVWRLAIAALALLLLLVRQAPCAEENLGFVGMQTCGTCHAAQFEAWKRSHHAAAMQPATPATVLGDFS